MAKNRRRRRRITLIKGTIDLDEALGTLAAQTALLDATDSVDDSSWLLSTECTYALDHTAGEGPVKLFWAHSDYSLVEVEEFIELATGWGNSDEGSKEISRRKIRQIGEFAGTATDEVLNDGKSIKTKIGFRVGPDQGLNLVTYNDDANPLTTGASIKAKGHCWIKPL